MRNAGRKILALVLASLMILTLAACNKKQQLGTSLPKASPDAHAVSDKLQETKTESPTAQTEEEFHWERVQTPLPDGESTIRAQAEAHGTVIAVRTNSCLRWKTAAGTSFPCRMISCTETPSAKTQTVGSGFSIRR